MSPRRQHPADAPAAERAASPEMAPQRVRARRWVATVLRTTLDDLVAAGKRGATQRAVAGRLGVSHTQVQRWCGDGDPAVTLGDILAMGAEVARPVLVRALASLDGASGGSTRDSLDGVAIELGQAVQGLHADLADGREDHPAQHAAALERIAAIALRGSLAARRRAEGGAL